MSHGTIVVLATAWLAGAAACGDDGGRERNGGSGELEQYTPDQANWNSFASKPLAGGNTSHDPDGVGWISQDDWAMAQWDGTIYNPSKMTAAEFAAAICPSVDRVRGLRDVFYQHEPFADNANPTKAEVDEWHRIAINHVRALVGYTSEDRQVVKDHCMFSRALWGDERKFTTMWDEKYPGVDGSAAGPCQGSTNAHCGASFIPDLDDQAPYLPSGHPGCTAQAGAEGVFSGPKSNIPWSIKWSRGLCNTARRAVVSSREVWSQLLGQRSAREQQQRDPPRQVDGQPDAEPLLQPGRPRLRPEHDGAVTSAFGVVRWPGRDRGHTCRDV